MRLRYFYLFIFSLFFFLISCTSSDFYHLYDNGIYSYQWPVNFTEVSIANNDIGFKDEGTGILLTSKYSPASLETLDPLYTEFKTSLLGISGAQLLDSKSYTQDAKEIRKIVMTYPLEERVVKHTLFFIYSNNKIVMLALIGSLDKHDAQYEVLEHALSTLKIN